MKPKKNLPKLSQNLVSKFTHVYARRKDNNWHHVAYSCMTCNSRFLNDSMMENHKCKRDDK